MKPPLLDSALAEMCMEIKEPIKDDYDVWQEWVQSVVLRAYGECAAKHAKTVKAWPK